MPIDFKASQIRTSRIISSGSDEKPYLMIYPSSSATNDSGGYTNINSVGNDAWLFVSGGINDNHKSLFGGDVTISGSFVVDPQLADSLISANVNSNPFLSRLGIKNNSPESTVHIGGSNDPGLLVDTGAIINYGRNNSSSATFLVQSKLGGDHGLLVVSGCCDRVSIGKHNPNAKLDVYGSGIFSGSLDVTGSLISPDITGSIKYIDRNLTVPFIVGSGISYNDASKQWLVSNDGFVNSIKSPSWRGITTGSTTTEIFIDGGTGRYQLPMNKTHTYIILVSARQIGGSSGTIGDSKWFRIEGGAKNVNGSSTILGSNSIYDDSDAAASLWDVSISVDDSTDCLKVDVTGEANKTIDWSVVSYPANNAPVSLTLDGQFNWFGETSDATPTEIFLDNISKRLPVKTNGNHTFTLIGNGISTAGACRWFKIDGSIKNVGGTTSIVGSTTTYDDGDIAAATWDITATADNTNDSLKITVTGAAATNITWNVTGYVTDSVINSSNLQSDIVVWNGYTTGSSLSEIYTGGISKQLNIVQDSTKTFQIIGHGYQVGGSSGTTGSSRWFRINGAIKNVAGTTSLASSTYSYDDGDGSTTTWDIVVGADDTNDALTINVQGENNKQIEWFVKGYITNINDIIGIGCSKPVGKGSEIQFNDGGIFGGDNLFTWNKYTSTLKATNLSGSLTKLTDGTDYLVAGTNITLSTGSNGSITINSTGGGASSLQAAYNGGNSIDLAPSFGLFVFDSSLASLPVQFGQVSNEIGNFDIASLGTVTATASSIDLQSATINLATTLASNINIGAIGNATNIEIAGDGKLQLLADPGGAPLNVPPAGSIQILAKSQGGVGFSPSGGEIAIESANGFTVNTNGHMTLQMNSFSNETLNIFASNAFSLTPNIQIRSDGSSASNSIDITSHNNGGISIGSNASYNTGDILIGNQETQRDIDIGKTTTVEQYVNLGSSYGASTTALNGKVSITNYLASNVVPDLDSTYTLGTPANRFAHVYTGDLHLRNERGDWTILEEREYLCVINNITGKRYKMSLTPLDEE